MARNEEKQLARLNRFYLQKQREEDLKKRPPRPKLETLTTPEELRKWLPSITRDIEFYVKQMEVTCYRDQHIEDFSQRISHLRGEYKAFLRKLRELDPDEKLRPWTDRPYSVKKSKVSRNDVAGLKDTELELISSEEISSNKESTQPPVSFVPLQTPVLDNDDQKKLNFGYEKRVVAYTENPNLSDENMDQPLQFAPMILSANLTRSDYDISKHKSCVPTPRSGHTNSVVPCVSSGSLNLPYSDSSSSEDET